MKLRWKEEQEEGGQGKNGTIIIGNDMLMLLHDIDAGHASASLLGNILLDSAWSVSHTCAEFSCLGTNVCLIICTHA